MREIILKSIKRVKKFLIAATLLLAINLAANGRADLIGAALIGYMLAAFYIASTAARLQAIATMNQAAAKRRWLIGLALRLLMVFVVFNIAVHLSTEIFFTSAISFMIFYAAALLGLIMTSYKQKLFGDDDD